MVSNIGISFSRGLFSGAMLVSGRVPQKQYHPFGWTKATHLSYRRCWVDTCVLYFPEKCTPLKTNMTSWKVTKCLIGATTSYWLLFHCNASFPGCTWIYIKVAEGICFHQHDYPCLCSSKHKIAQHIYMGVSKNRGGPPKVMVKIMENPMNKWMIWGVSNPLFLETPI